MIYSQHMTNYVWPRIIIYFYELPSYDAVWNHHMMQHEIWQKTLKRWRKRVTRFSLKFRIYDDQVKGFHLSWNSLWFELHLKEGNIPNPLPSISGLLTLFKLQTVGRLKLNLTSAALNDCTQKSFYCERIFVQVFIDFGSAFRTK